MILYISCASQKAPRISLAVCNRAEDGLTLVSVLEDSELVQLWSEDGVQSMTVVNDLSLERTLCHNVQNILNEKLHFLYAVTAFMEQHTRKTVCIVLECGSHDNLGESRISVDASKVFCGYAKV